MRTTTHHRPLLSLRQHRRTNDEPPTLDLGRVLLGLVIITIGTLYLLQSADALDAGQAIDRWWPTVLITMGIFQLLERSHGQIGPYLLIAAGVLLLLATTDVLPGDAWSYIWPTALIVMGVATIARWSGAGRLPRTESGDVVIASGIFGGPTLVNASQTFRGASLTAVFGGVELDLRDARPAPEGARITATAAFGGIDIVVPHGWRLTVRATPFFGGVDDKTEHSGELPENAPTLFIDALAVFGGVEIRHPKRNI